MVMIVVVVVAGWAWYDDVVATRLASGVKMNCFPMLFKMQTFILYYPNWNPTEETLSYLTKKMSFQIHMSSNSILETLCSSAQ